MSMSHLLVLLDLMQFGVGNDSFKLVEPFLHQSEAEPGRLLLLPDSFKLSPPHLLGNTGTLLPLLDPLREDLIDTTEEQKQTVIKTLMQTSWRLIGPVPEHLCSGVLQTVMAV